MLPLLAGNLPRIIQYYVSNCQYFNGEPPDGRNYIPDSQNIFALQPEEPILQFLKMLHLVVCPPAVNEMYYQDS